MKVEELARELRNHLSPEYGLEEASAMTSLIFHHLKGWNRTELIVNGDLPVSDRILAKTGEILARLERHEPIQYILGEARFYGMDLKVCPGVLVPRPETAGLVDIIADAFRSRSDLNILDIGTGSGAIAIALARNLPFSHVTGIDISEDALDIARENDRNLKAGVNFLLKDIFTWNPGSDMFDIIVSNPPYITEEERKDMDANVLDYEPEQALFVPDDDPLKYYRRIGELSANALKGGGTLYFEINPRFAGELRDMLEAFGFRNVEIIRDSYGRLRFATARKERNGE